MEVSNDKDFSSPKSRHPSALSLDEVENRNVGEAFWNLPNTITMLRVLVIPAILVFPFYINDFTSQIAGWLFVFAGVTDVVDGWLARRGQQVTRIGKLLDPLADKLLVTVCLVVLVSIERIPIWATTLVVVIIGRELAVTGLRGIASAGGQVLAADWRGKLKTLTQNLAIGALLFPGDTLGLPLHFLGLVMLSVATVLTLWSGYVYFARYFRSAETE
tara:strand:+ start:1476 stop:2126 length:651 start_codon:yes stop_codon:yes gene_type:complete